MPSNYTALRQDQERLLRTINNSGRLIAGLYADRTHFIYELLQNAEDALARRPLWGGSRAVRFTLSQDSLRVTHWGKPFDNRDVEGICSIGESTKELTDIGRFGIGFKSVYAFTDRPEVHSGSEDFAIEDFVFPTAAPGLERSDDETVILLPEPPRGSKRGGQGDHRCWPGRERTSCRAKVDVVFKPCDQ